jgi:hypothetical protein
MLLCGLAVLAAVGAVQTASAAALPALGEPRQQVEQQHGPAYIVQEDKIHFYTGRQWRELGKKRAKAYGYPLPVRELNSTLWIEYDTQDRVAKQMVILDGNIKIRYFGRYFPELHAALTANDSAAAVIRSYPRDQFAVRIQSGQATERWVRFFFTNDDQTCLNMHSKIHGFEIADSLPQTITGPDKAGITAGCKFNGEFGEFPADGTWQRADNYFRPGLYFSEKLVPRRGTDLVVVHHAAMPITTSRDDIQDLHLSNGWAGVGYHKLVFADGSVAEGRPEPMVGAHAFGANRRSLGIVLVGDFNRERPDPVQLESAARLTVELLKKYRLPVEKVLPHRAVNLDTDCPGRLFPWAEFVQRLRRGMTE